MIFGKTNAWRKCILLTIVSGLLWISISGIASAGSNAGMAGAFLRMGLGARNLAMGDVGVSIPGNGYGIYYNAASLPFMLQSALLTSYSYLALDRRFNFIGAATPLRPTAKGSAQALHAGLGIGWINASPGEIDGRDRDGNPIGTFNYSDNAFYFAFGLRLSKYLAIGIAPTVLYSSFPNLTSDETLKSARLGFDAGIMANPYRTLFLGVQARHINAQYRWDTTTLWGEEGTIVVDKLPRVYRLGASYLFGFGLMLAGDFETSDQTDNQLHLGGEYLFQNTGVYQFSLRAGYDDQNYAMGLGFGFPVWKLQGQLDYAYQILDVPPFDSQIISLAIGWRGDKDRSNP
jgi:hypothetical protein